MENPETLATLCTQDTGRRQTKHKNTTLKMLEMGCNDYLTQHKICKFDIDKSQSVYAYHTNTANNKSKAL